MYGGYWEDKIPEDRSTPSVPDSASKAQSSRNPRLRGLSSLPLVRTQPVRTKHLLDELREVYDDIDNSASKRPVPPLEDDPSMSWNKEPLPKGLEWMNATPSKVKNAGSNTIPETVSSLHHRDVNHQKAGVLATCDSKNSSFVSHSETPNDASSEPKVTDNILGKPLPPRMESINGVDKENMFTPFKVCKLHDDPHLVPQMGLLSSSKKQFPSEVKIESRIDNLNYDPTPNSKEIETLFAPFKRSTVNSVPVPDILSTPASCRVRSPIIDDHIPLDQKSTHSDVPQLQSEQKTSPPFLLAEQHPSLRTPSRQLSQPFSSTPYTGYGKQPVQSLSTPYTRYGKPSVQAPVGTPYTGYGKLPVSAAGNPPLRSTTESNNSSIVDIINSWKTPAKTTSQHSLNHELNPRSGESQQYLKEKSPLTEEQNLKSKENNDLDILSLKSSLHRKSDEAVQPEANILATKLTPPLESVQKAPLSSCPLISKLNPVVQPEAKVLAPQLTPHLESAQKAPLSSCPLISKLNPAVQPEAKVLAPKITPHLESARKSPVNSCPLISKPLIPAVQPEAKVLAPKITPNLESAQKSTVNSCPLISKPLIPAVQPEAKVLAPKITPNLESAQKSTVNSCPLISKPLIPAVQPEAKVVAPKITPHLECVQKAPLSSCPLISKPLNPLTPHVAVSKGPTEMPPPSEEAPKPLNKKIREPENNIVNPSKFSAVGRRNTNDQIVVNGKPYTVLSLLGRGGSSAVYLVLEPASSKLLAVKCVNLSELDQSTYEGYLNEISLLSQLQDSDCVIRMYDHQHCKDEKILYVVMEKGETDLSRLIRDVTRTKEVSPAMTVYYWIEMLNAVSFIHKRGTIHSDLKPANFLLVAGRLKLIDFGIASSIQGDMTSVVKDSMTGTYNYISPEALCSTGCGPDGRSMRFKISYKSDVWSLGCILYNLVYGHTPFQTITSTFMKMTAIADPNHKIPFPPAPGFPKALLLALQACLVRNPKLRPSVDELLQYQYLGSVGPVPTEHHPTTGLIDQIKAVVHSANTPDNKLSCIQTLLSSSK